MEGCSNLLDLISKERQVLVKTTRSPQEQNLELRLGPPGEDKEEMQKNGVSVGCLPVMVKESQTCCNRGSSVTVDLKQKQSPANTAVVPNSSQKRTAPGPVVGWPPVRSFRKNLASSSNNSNYSKPPSAFETQNGSQSKKVANVKQEAPVPCKTSKFVKINMDGVPIGRKVDISAYGSYLKLSVAVDHLFRGLLAAQRNSSADEDHPITGVLGGNGEFTLIYEDSEGDKMLVGDVPWDMFVSTVKRLRVLKSSDVAAFQVGGCNKREHYQMKQEIDVNMHRAL